MSIEEYVVNRLEKVEAMADALAEEVTVKNKEIEDLKWQIDKLKRVIKKFSPQENKTESSGERYFLSMSSIWERDDKEAFDLIKEIMQEGGDNE